MKKKLFTIILSLVAVFCLVFGVSACAKGSSHKHSYALTWTYDAEYHWHKATCEHTTEISGKATHSFGSDDVCSICGYKKGTAVPSNPSDAYTVVFDSNDGSFSNGYTLELTIDANSLLTTPEEPIRDGYVFAGWAKNINGTQLWDFANDRVTSNITLYAVWLQEFTITFDANGGKFSDEKTTIDVVLYFGAKLSTIETPERAGHTFTGWYTNSSLTDLWDFDNNTISSAITLYAGWKADIQEHNVTFVLNYSGAENVVRSTEDGLITYVPTRAGYVFNGWWYSDGQTDEGYILSRKFDTTEIVTEDNLILYAEWVEESKVSSQLAAPSVSINERVFSWIAVNGATDYNIRVYKSGASEELANETITGTSWTFPSGYEAGYYNVRIRANGDGRNTVNSSYVSKSYAHNILGTISNISFDISTSILTWTAVKNATEYELYINGQLVDTLTYTTYDLSDYEAGAYTIKIISKKNGYQSSTTTKSIEKKRLKTPAEVRTFVNSESKGYTITWDAVAHADTYLLQIGDREISLTDTTYVISSSANYWVEQSLTFTIQAFDSNTDYLISNATEEITLGKIYNLTTDSNFEDVGELGINGKVYVPQEYVVSFNLNGASGSIVAQAVTTSNGLTYPSIPTRSGYVFRGWYTDEACSNLYDFTSAVTKNITLYAGWYDISTSGYSTNVIDITSNYNTSSSAYSASNRYATSSSNANYVYFRALTGGSYTFYYRNATSNSSSYGTYFYLYNATKGTYVLSNTSTYSTTYSSKTFTAEAGDVYYVRTYKYSSSTSYYSSYYFYVTGASIPTAGGKVVGGDYMEAESSDLSSVLVAYGTELSVTATTKDNRYIFEGWYDGDDLLSEDRTYIFTMPDKDVQYTAKWKYYSVTTEKNIEDAGSITSYNDTPVKVGDSVTITASTNNGYTWLGWYNGDDQLTDALSYTFTMTEQSVKYTAKWTFYTVNTTTNVAEGGTYTEKTDEKVTVGTEVTLEATINDGYMWMGWYKGDTFVSSELTFKFSMPAENIVYTAKWMECPVTLAKNIEEAGSVRGLGSTTVVGEQITIIATTNSGYTWLGWYNGEQRLTEDLSYSFTMPTEKVVYTAKWTYYTLTLVGTEGGSIGNRVSFNLNGGEGKAPEAQTITTSKGLVYPDIPTRSGYLFTGWYTECTCINLFDFSKTINSDTVLYAGWYAVGTDSMIEINQYTSDSPFSFSTSGTSSSTPKYTYFRALATGDYTFGYKNGSGNSSYATYLYIYDVTVNSVVKSNNYYYSTSWNTTKLSLTAGHVYYMRTYMRSYSSTFSVYLSGTLKPEDGGLSEAIEGNKATKITVGESVTITAATKNGYTWLGWYNGEQQLTGDLSYTFDMPAANVSYTAKWQLCAVTLAKNIEEAGSVSGIEGATKVGEQVTIVATTNAGYTFDGWYSGEQRLTESESYSFTMTADAVTYTAKWSFYTVTTNGNVTNGEVSDAGTYTVKEAEKVTAGTSVTLKATVKNGYTWLGWYNGEQQLTEDLSYTFDMPAANVSYTAKWQLCAVTLAKNIEEAGSVKGVEGATKVGEQVTIVATTNAGYTFDGWYSGEQRLTESESYSFTMTADAVTYTAKWSFYTVTTNGNVTNGEVSDAGTYTVKEAEKVTAGTSVTLTATVNDGYTWLGWYNGEQQLTEDLNYTFDMPSANVSYTAKWTYYTLTTTTNNGLGGSYTIKEAEKVTAGTSVTLTATVNDGYTWLGWYNGEQQLTEDLSYTFDMPSANVVYTAKYDAYTLTVNKTNGGTTGMLSAKVSFDLNEAAGTAPATQTVTDKIGLTYPDIPTRSGFLFTGWYKDKSCTELFNFTSNVDKDMTLYAGWYDCSNNRSMEIGQYSSYSPLAISLSGTSSTEPVYVYFRALRTGNYTFGYKNSSSSSSYSSYFYIYDVTAATVLSANTSVASTSFATKSLALTEGHTYYVRLYRYSSSYSPTFSIYLTGTLKPTAGGKTTGNTEVSNYMIAAGTEVTLVARTEEGYTFLGWYNDSQLLSTELTYKFDMPASSVTYTAKWISCPVTVTVNNEEAGSVSALPTTTIVGQEVSVTATTNAGYTFLGWYEGDLLLSGELKYTFAMPSAAKTITAKWVACPVTITVNDSNAGSTSALPSTTIAGKDVTVTATTNDGYTFLGWYSDESCLTTELSYTFAMPSTATTYTAKWIACPVTLNKNIDEAGSVSGVEGATRVGEQTTIVATTNAGYTFDGWYNGEQRLTESESYSFTMTADAVTYTAKWAYYTLTLVGTEGGSIGNRVSFNLNGGEGKAPEAQTITTSKGLVYPDIPTRSGYLFTGWYTESTCINLFDFSKTITSDTVLYAGWYAVGTDSMIEVNQYTSDSPFSFSTSGTSSSAPKYTYFRALVTDKYTLGYKNGYGSYSYATYLYIYDVTANKEIKSNSYYYNTSWSTLSLSLTAGHIYYMRTYMYSYSSTFSVYLSGTLKPADGGLSEAIESNKATKITAGESVTITATTLEGYVWLGWYNGEQQLTEDLSYTFEMPKDNVTYTAKWTSYSLTVNKTEGGTVEEYYGAVTVTFDLQGGSGSIAPQTITHESGLKYPTIIPVKSGHIFTGWYSDENCTALYDFTQKLDRDITLYAGWYKLSGNVIEINEYSSSSPYSFSTEDTSSSKPSYTYFRALASGQYTFGYQNGSSSSYYGTYVYIYDVTASKVLKANTSITSTSFITEKFSLEAGHVYYLRTYCYSYSTTFSMYIQGTLLPNDGGVCDSIKTSSERILPGQRVTLIASTERNYTFLGWYNGDERLTESLVYTFVMPKDSITYTAKWAGYTVTVTPTEGGDAERIFKHTVEFNENYDGGSVTQQIVLADDGLKYTIPTRAGYIFTGWYTEDACKNLYDFTATIYDDVVLYAGWVQYTLGTFVEVNEYSESNPYTMTTNGTSSSNYGYIRFRALVSGEYTFGYKLANSYSTYLYIYDATEGKALKSNSYFSSTSWNTLTLQLTATHVYYARIYRSSTSTYTDFSMYLTGTKLPADGGKSFVDNKVAVGDQVTIQATTKQGYTWLGWYLDNEFVTKDMTYTFSMPNKSVVYEARWTCYTVTTNTNAEGGGTITQMDAQKVANGDQVTLTATLNDGYTWLGWYEGDDCLSQDMNYSFTMDARDHVITAKYGFEEVTLHYIVDGVEVHSQDMTFENSLQSLYDYSAKGKNFDGWYADSACNSAMEKVTDTTKLKANSENKVYLYGATYVGTANLTFEKAEDEYRVTGYEGEETAVVLPSQYNGLPVTQIADRAFYANDSLYRVTVSTSINQIGTYAFYLCYRLTEIDNLSELAIVVGETNNGYIAYYATKVYNTEDANGERIITDNNGYVFYYDGVKYYLIDYTGTSDALTLPDDVKNSNYEIAAHAFYNRDFTSVVLSSGVTKVGEYAFSNCAKLASVRFGKNVESVAETAFYMCGELRTLSLDEENTYLTCVDNNLIDKATKTLIVGCSDSIPSDDSVTAIGQYAFAWRSNIANVTISNHITEIKPYAFYGCTGLTSLVIQSGITKIGEYAFYNAAFSTVTVPSTVKLIGYAAFGGNGNITTMTLPFVGGDADASIASESTLFGYIFGKDSYSNSTRTVQYYETSQSVAYYIPTSLTSIHITGGSILYGAFYGCSRLADVNVSVVQIGDRAFYNCYGVSTLSISNARTIGSYSFANCYRLSTVSIPSTVSTIGSAALYGCYGITQLTIPFVGSSSSASVASEETLFGYIFGTTEYSNSTAVEQRYGSSYSSSYSQTYYLPKNLTSVQVLRGSLLYGAFYGCSALESVTLSSVTSVGDYAFYNCKTLSEIVIPYSTTSIGDYAFYNCVALTKATIGNGVNTIDPYAFSGCTTLHDVTIGSNVSSIGYNAFSGCTALQEISIPNKVTAISSSLFSGCSALKQVTLQGNITSIRSSAFSGCSALTAIAIPSTVQQIETKAFANSGLTSLALPSSLSSTGLGNGIVYGCNNLKTLTISGSSIYSSSNNCIIRSNSVVLGCVGSTIPTSSVTSIGSYAFYGCMGKTSITIPSNITSIGSYAFSESGLTAVTIPSGVTSVGERAFSASKLSSATFSGSTTAIGKYAFAGCGSLTKVTLPTAMTAINEGLFNGCSRLASISIPTTVQSIGASAFSGCSSLTSIVVPANVTTIGAEAFARCEKLETISLPFIGGSSSASTASATTLFGYIFGDSSNDTYYGASAVTQSYSSGKSVTYYIPKSLKTVTLTTDCKLMYGAFQNCYNISTVNFYSSSTITSIPAYAFYNTGITSFTFPKGVTSIANTAFQNCSKLTSISIPSTVTSLGEGTLNGCSGLTSVTLPFVGGNATLQNSSAGYPFGYVFGSGSYSGGIATSQSYYSHMGYQTKSTATYYIPAGLTSVTILNGTTGVWSSYSSYLSYGAFSGLTKVTSITLPTKLGAITQNVFYESTALTGITIPNTVTTIGDYAFYGCTSLSNVTFQTTSKVSSIGLYAFHGCAKLTSITLPSSLTSLSSSFVGTGLTSITIPSNVTSYGSFENCTALTTVKFSGSKITFIGGFSGCTALSSITLPSSTTTIGIRAFENCRSLTSITIPSKVTTINSYAFSGCTGLTSVTFSSTSGWKAGSTSVTVTNKTTNVTNLTSTYVGYTWTKS